jgi:hypothetical protein
LCDFEGGRAPEVVARRVANLETLDAMGTRGKRVKRFVGKIAFVIALGFVGGLVVGWSVYAASILAAGEADQGFYLARGTALYFAGPFGGLLAPIAYVSLLRDVPLKVSAAWTGLGALLIGVPLGMAHPATGAIGALLGFFTAAIMLNDRWTTPLEERRRADDPVS